MTRIVENRAGVLVSTEAAETSAGAGDAGRIPQLDSAGILDPSLLPGGGVVSWGDIIGTLSSQADLVAALADKLDDSQASAYGLTVLAAANAAALKALLSLVKADVGLGNVDNTADAAKNVLTATKLFTARNFSLSGGGITAPTVSFDGSGNVVLVPTVGAITPTSVAASGAVSGSNLSGTNTGDQASIVGITGTKAQFDTAVTDGNFLYVGDITQYTDEMAQDAVGAMVDASLVYVDGTPLLTRAALTGDATAAQGSNALTVVKINGVSMAGLATGILKNTTGTGAPSIAVAADFPTLNQNTTGSAATLTTSRNFSISGGGITAATVGFNGSAAVVLNASVDEGHITLARMADVATSTVFYRKTAGTGAPEVQTLATLKADLGLTGTNTGDQTITLTGDVTGSGTGSFAATIANDAVTFAKFQNIATAKVLGRMSALTGDVEELPTTGTGNVVLSASPTLTGTLTAATATFSGTITQGAGTGTGTLILKGGSGAGSNVGQLDYERDGSGVVGRIETLREGSNDSGVMVFYTKVGAGALTERLRISSTGVMTLPGQFTLTNQFLSSKSAATPDATFTNWSGRFVSTTAAAVDVGPSLLFAGESGNGVTPYALGGIHCAKASSTAGDYTGYWRLLAPNAAGTITEVLRGVPGLVTITGSTVLSGAAYYAQAAPTARNSTTTLTIADLLTFLITSTSAVAVSLTLPTGTLTDAGILSGTLANDRAFEWYLINLGSASGAVTLLAGATHTIVGNAVTAISTSSRWLTRKTATNTFVTYRIG